MVSYPPGVAGLTARSDPMAPEPSGQLRVLLVAGPGANGRLVEPLTSRELTVLRYLQGTLSHAEIAALLYISVNTVKSHVKNLYRKLGTRCRKDAVRHGRELRLL
jgi:LuxR family maltose regulon positive regulatory protein